MKTFTLAFIGFTVANFTVALTGAYSFMDSSRPYSDYCDFWLKQKGDPTFMAVKHSYCVRRGGK